MESECRYTYTPLSSPRNVARLVTILPGTLDTTIQCTLEEFDFREPPKYCALSYVWGNPMIGSDIKINGKKLFVPQNLYDALLHIRFHDKPRRLWIDSICINQGDVKERNKQIVQMRSIYTIAGEVLVWLGTEQNDSTLAMSLASVIGGYWADQKASSETRFDLATADEFFARIASNDIVNLLENLKCKLDIVAVVAFNHLITRPWFERVWIIQEVTTHVGTKTVQCGSSKTDWWNLLTTARFILHAVRRSDISLGLDRAEPLDSTSMRGMFNIYHLQENIESGRWKTTLLDTLASYRHYKATDPRDKVYALLSIVSENTRDIRPDYSLSLSEVYLATAVYFTRRYYTLDFLGFCNPLRSSTDIPSWVPDWRDTGPSHPFALYTRHRSHADDDTHEQQKIYNASIHYRESPQIRIYHQTLFIEGFRLSRIHSIGSAFNPETDPSGSALFTWQYSPPYIAPFQCPDDAEALSHTLVADVSKRGRDRQRGFSLTLSYWRSLVGTEYSLRKPPPDERYRVEWGSLMFAGVGRALACTEDGHMCLAPGGAQVGDWVCGLDYGHVFHVLRETQKKKNYDRWCFVGECYVHGMMDQEKRGIVRKKRELFAID